MKKKTKNGFYVLVSNQINRSCVSSDSEKMILLAASFKHKLSNQKQLVLVYVGRICLRFFDWNREKCVAVWTPSFLRLRFVLYSSLFCFYHWSAGTKRCWLFSCLWLIPVQIQSRDGSARARTHANQRPIRDVTCSAPWAYIALARRSVSCKTWLIFLFVRFAAILFFGDVSCGFLFKHIYNKKHALMRKREIYREWEKAKRCLPHE